MPDRSHESGGGPLRSPATARRPVRREGYQLETLEDELLLFDPDNATILYCNQTAALVWALCDGTRTEDAIVALLRDAFPDPDVDVGTDVRAVVEQLVSVGAASLQP